MTGNQTIVIERVYPGLRRYDTPQFPVDLLDRKLLPIDTLPVQQASTEGHGLLERMNDKARRRVGPKRTNPSFELERDTLHAGFDIVGGQVGVTAP